VRIGINVKYNIHFTCGILRISWCSLAGSEAAAILFLGTGSRIYKRKKIAFGGFPTSDPQLWLISAQLIYTKLPALHGICKNFLELNPAVSSCSAIWRLATSG